MQVINEIINKIPVLKKIWKFFEKNANTLIALVTLVTLIFMITTWNLQIESMRPYIAISDNPRIVERVSPQGIDYPIRINYENQGGRIASNINGEVYLFNQNLIGPIGVSKISIGNDLSINFPNTWYGTFNLTENTNPKYILIDMTYDDPFTSKKYNQKFFLKWTGILDNSLDREFTQATPEDRIIMEEFLKHN